MNRIINSQRGALPVVDRVPVSVRPRAGYDMLYVNRHTVTEPADETQPTVTVDETVIVDPAPVDPDISVKIAALLLEEDTPQPFVPVIEPPRALEAIAEEPEVQPVVEEVVIATEEPVREEIFEQDFASDPVFEEPVQIEVNEVVSSPVHHQGIPELPLEKKVDAMTKALEKARNDLDKEHQKRFALKRVTLGLVGVILLLATGYVGIDTWMTNSQVKADTSQTSDTPNPVPDPSQEGKDTTPLPANALANYNVAPNLPRALYIEKLGVAARLLQMNTNPDGTIQAPRNIFDAGWYTGSVKPGETGAVFVDGHSSGRSHEGLFGNLDSLVVGDVMQIEKGDGTRLVYQVVFKETVKLEDVDMRKALKPYGGATKGLNLMTCAGTWTADDTTMTERTIVYTQQI